MVRDYAFPGHTWCSFGLTLGADKQFGGDLAVGSEEARCRASLRPPLKLYVPVSGMQLSRRRS